MLESGVEGQTVLDGPLDARLEAKALDCGILIDIVIFFSCYGGFLTVNDDIGGKFTAVEFFRSSKRSEEESAFFSQCFRMIRVLCREEVFKIGGTIRV